MMLTYPLRLGISHAPISPSWFDYSNYPKGEATSKQAILCVFMSWSGNYCKKSFREGGGDLKGGNEKIIV
jgi:hypothetical protein